MTIDLRTLAERAFLRLLPTGGQQTARRNAWAGMSELSHRGRDHDEADRALDAALTALLVPEVRPVAAVR